MNPLVTSMIAGRTTSPGLAALALTLAGGSGPTVPSNLAPTGPLKQYARKMTRQMFGPGHFPELKQLWNHESGWNPDAANPTSSARGIPQAMMSVHFGDDWQTDPAAKRFLRDPYEQIEWGLNYIKTHGGGMYGNPTGAWDYWQKHGNY